MPGRATATERSAPVRDGILEVRLFGECALTFAGEPLTRIDSPRMQSLLAYLLLHPSAPQSRQYLAFLLWPESAEEQARTNLRQLLHHLKHALPEWDRFLTATAKTLQWNSRSQARLDVADFDRLLDEGRAQDAVTLYRGRLLPSCYDDWIQPERERLEQRYRDALATLAQTAMERGDHDAAIRWGKQRVRAAPVDEAAHLQLIRAQLAIGNRAEAMQAYHACAEALSRELGVAPSPATVSAYQTLLRTEVAEPARLGIDSALVARSSELGKLKALVAQAQAGQPSVAVILGEAGLGKSRLADELRRWSLRQGLATAWARAYPTNQTLAYAPVTEWLRGEALRTSLNRLPPVVLSELSRLLPEVLADRPDVASPPAQGWQRLRLFEALARAALSPERPQLLVLDDLQWCDQETLDFLAFLLRFAPTSKLLVVATARVEELAPGHPATQWMGALPSLTRLELEPLDPAETEALASSVAGRRLNAAEAANLYRDTDGNPLFVVESVRSGQEAPRGPAILAARLDAVSDPTRELLGLAAANGRAFSFELLAHASRRTEAELVECLDEAWSKRLIRDHGEAGYDFAHDRLREEAYGRLSTARKRVHHAAIASALRRQSPAVAERMAAQIAQHLDRAGRADEAIGWYERAALSSRRLSAHAESVALLERALALGGADASQRELSLLIALGVSLVALRGYGAPRVLEVYRRAQKVAAGLEVVSAPVLRALAIAELVRGELREAEATGARLLDATGADPVITVEAKYVLGVTAFWLGQFSTCVTHLEDSIRHTRPELLPVHREQFAQDPEPVCLIRLSIALVFAGRPDAALARSEEALCLAREREHAFTLAYVLHWKTWLHVLREDDVALESAEESLAFSRRQEFAYWHTQGQVLRGYLRADRAELREGLAAFAETGTQVGRSYFLMLEARLAQGDGQRAEARGLLDEALTLARTREERWPEAELLRAKANLAASGGTTRWKRSLVGLGTVKAAVTDLRTAIEVAQAQGAFGVLIRAAEDLCALRPSAREELRSRLDGLLETVEASMRKRLEALLRTSSRRRTEKFGSKNGR